MACPIHLWIPLAAAAAPVARIARNRISAWRSGTAEGNEPAEPQREVKRWAPVGAPESTERSSD